MFLKFKIKMVLLLMLCIILFSGGAYAMYALSKTDDVVAGSKEIKNANVSYTDDVIASFNQEDKFTFYNGELHFKSVLKSDKSNSTIGDFFVGKETTIYVVGDLEAGVHGADIAVSETSDTLTLTVDKDDIFRTFKADKIKSGVQSESGVFALDYDAETISKFWGEIEGAGATTEITKKDWENIKTSVQNGLTTFTEKLIDADSPKDVIVQIAE